MVGKNNTQERFRRNATKDKRYTLKKLSVGLASVALGTVLFLNGAETVSAEAEVVDPNTPAAQPVQETFQFNYLNQATGARLDGFFGDYVNANEAEKAFRHYANEQGYTLLNVRLEGHTFTADVAVEQGVQPEVEQEAQPAESTFQFIYRDKETGEKFDSFFGDYVNENEAEKDFRHYANQHGYTLLNVRLEGHTFTADVAVEQEAQPAESAFQFIYRDKETGEKFDSFFGDYANENEAEKDFRHYANQHGYTLLNVRQNGHTFTADVARDSQSEETPEVEKGYSYALNFDGRTESANLGEFDSEEQAELALRIFANEQGYELSNLRLEGRTFHADAKVAAEADEPSESTDRYLQEAKDRARGIINGLENLFDTQKPSYLERIEDADSVAAVEAIVEEAQNYVNEGKGGENGQATEEPEKPEYNPEENLVTYDLQITDQNGRTQTQKVTFPSRELALNYISQLVRSYEKAGVVLNEERSDVEGKDNTFILVFEEKQAEEPAKADYTVKVIVDGEERQSQALPDTTRQGAIDYAERLAKSYEQDGFTYNHLDAGLPSDTVIRIELSSPELDVPSHTEDAPAPEALDVTKAEALDIIAGLDLDNVIKDNLVYEINQAEDEAAVGQVIAKAYKIVAAGLAEEQTPELDPEEEAGRELDAAKAEALDAIAGLEYLSEEEKAGFVDRINETTELGEVNRLVGLAFKRNIENFPEKTPELDPEEEAGRELDAAKAEALDAIAGLEHLSEEEKAGFVDRINETTELGEVNRLVGLAFKRNIENFPETTPELDPEEEAGRELDTAKAEALEAIERLEYLSDEDKEGFVDRINDADDEAEVNRLVGVAHKQNINNLPKPLDVPGYVEDAPAPEVLDEAKTEALDQIAELDYFTEEEKQDLIDRINEYDNLGDVDFIVSKAIEENDRRHLEKEAELQAAKDTLSAKINTLVEDATRKAEFLEAVEGAETLEALESIDDNVDSYVSIQDHEELEAAKAALTTKVGAVVERDEDKVGFLQEIDKAETLEDLLAIEGRVDALADTADEAELQAAKDTLNAKINTLVEDATRKAEFLEAVESAETLEALESIDDNVDSYVSIQDHEEFEAAKAALTTKVGAVVERDEDKVGFLQEIDKAETLEDLLAIEGRVDALADTADETELQAAKDTLNAKINTLVEDATRKAEFLEAVEGAETLEALESIDDNVDSYVSIQDHEEFEVAKENALKELHAKATEKANEIDQRIDLTEEEKDLAHTVIVANYEAGEEAINNATTVEEVAKAKQAGLDSLDQITIDGEAKQEAQNELHKVAQTKENEIEERIDLTEDEKTEAATKLVEEYNKAVEAINSAETNDDVTTAKDAGIQAINDIQLTPAAKQEAQNELHKVAQTKENEIEERIDLTEDEKTEAATKLVEEYNKAVEAINSAETNDDVTTAKDAGIQAINDIQLTPAAKQEAQNELHKVAQTKENEIEERDDLTAEEKFDAADKLVGEYNKAVEAINNAETNDDVTTAKDAGIQAINDIELDGQTKGEAIKNIDALPELTEEQKDTFKQQIDAAENEEEILEILSKAGNRNELNKEVKEAIDGIPELTDDQRDQYKKEVEEATSDDEVESVLSGLEHEAFENYVESAKDQVDKLTRLTSEEQQAFKNEIDEKVSGKDIDEVLGRAYKQNVQKAIDANQAVAKAEDKAKEADKFLKAAAEDGQITEDELKTARGKNEEIEELKEKAQAEIDKLPENVREDLQDRLNKVEAPVLPPVTPSTKVGVANNTIEQSPLDDNRKGIYYEKVKEADQLDDSDNKIDDILAALAAEVEVKKAEDKEAVAESLVKEAVADDEVTDGERKAINDANEVVRNLKEDAQKSVNGLSDSVSDLREHLQGRLNNVDEAKIPGDDTKEAKEAVEKAENKAKEADNFLKQAANDEEGITEQDLEKARQNNKEIEQLKEAAQEKLDKLSDSQQEVKTKLQDRLDKVNDIKLPPVSPSSKAELANRYIEASPLEEQRKNVYREKVKEADKLDDSDNKIDDILAALAAEVEVKKAEDKEAVAESLVKEAVADDEVTDGERKAINDANEVVRNLKEDAQKSVNGLSDSVSDLREHLQGRLNNVDEAKIPGDDTKEAKEAVEKAENKAKEADNFLKEAANDAEGITEQDLEKARTYNEDIAELKEKAQAEINKLPENVRKDLQERLNKVKSPGLPPVTPSSKAESANQTIDGASVLGEKRQQDYRDKVEAADKLENSEEKIDDILKALDAEIAVKKAEDKAKEASNLVEQAKGREVTAEEKDAIDSANKGVDHYKGQAEPKVTNLPDSVKDIKGELQERLDKVQKATLPSDGGDTAPDQDGAGSSDTGSDDGATPPTDGIGEGDAGSTEDGSTGDDQQTPGQGDSDGNTGSTDNGASESSDDQSDEPDENSDLKGKQSDATAALDKLSHLDDNQREQYKKDIENALDESTVDYIVDKAQLENIKELNTASKKDKDAEGRKEVTVEDQEEAKRNIEEIKDRLNNPNNNLTQKQRKELQDLLDEIEVPRTHHYLPEIGNNTKNFFNNSIVNGKAIHAHTGWNYDGSNNGTGGVFEQSKITFDKGDDILEVRTGFGPKVEINMGAGNDELIVHGTTTIAGISNVFRQASAGSVDGGEGTDTVILKGDSTQYLHGKHIPNFDRVELNGTNGHFQIKLSEMKDQKLGGNKPLIVSGVAGQGNTVDFDYGTRTRPRLLGEDFKNQPGQSIGNWTAQSETQTKDGKTYVVWRHKDSLESSAHDVWVENTLGVRG